MNRSDLPHILRLLDDPSPVVQESLQRALTTLEGPLPELLEALAPPIGLVQREQVLALQAEGRRMQLRAAWSGWFRLENEHARLEQALALLSVFQGAGDTLRTAELLEDLAEQFRKRGGAVDAPGLARFLFAELGFSGNQISYYDPKNSSLVHVIESRRGLPITLACLYMLVGSRLGLEIEGCNWPRHFYACTRIGGKLMLVDCFNEGQFLDVEAFLKMQGPSRLAAEAIIAQRAAAFSIITRIVGNLAHSYRQIEHTDDANLMVELIKMTEDFQAAGKGG
ncbi:MAG: hypothetical protein HYV27_19335 [Candidatus Hydrogenedentes bacterium]|nr:hypothetical protein [Candidatus Hydrogenedentota bacterium]